MAGRGEYAAIHTAIVDDPDFQELEPGAKLIFYTAKLILGPSGIEVVRCFVEQMMQLTRLSLADLCDGLNRLQDTKWLVHQGDVYWLRNGLKYNPNFVLENKKHRTAIDRHLKGLPRLEIVNAFAAYYDLGVIHNGMGIEWVSVPYANQVVGSRYTVEGSEAKASGGEPPQNGSPNVENPHAVLMPLLRENGFAADDTAGSIIKALVRKKVPTDAIGIVIQGLAMMRRAGKLEGLKLDADEPLNMRMLYAENRSQKMPLWREAEVEYYQQQPKSAPEGTFTPIAGILKALK